MLFLMLLIANFTITRDAGTLSKYIIGSKYVYGSTDRAYRL